MTYLSRSCFHQCTEKRSTEPPSLDTGNLSSDLQESHGHATRAWYTRPSCHGQQGNFFALLLSYTMVMAGVGVTAVTPRDAVTVTRVAAAGHPQQHHSSPLAGWRESAYSTVQYSTVQYSVSMVPEQILLAAAVSLAAISASEVELRRNLMRSRARPQAVRHHHAKHFGQQQAGGEQPQMVGVVTTDNGDN